MVKRKFVSVHLQIVLISTKRRYTYVLNVLWAWKSFWAQPMVLLGVMSHVEPSLGPFGGSVRLGGRRRTVCAECTSGMEIILGTPDRSPTKHWPRGSSFRSVLRLC